MIRKMLPFILGYLLFVNSFLYPAPGDDSPEEFIKAHISGSDDIRQFVAPEELERAGRLGITYENVSNKFLLNHGIPSDIKSFLTSDSLYSVTVSELEPGYRSAVLTVPGKMYEQTFYFKDGKYISPLTYHTKGYTRKSSKYFDFFIDNTQYFNDYSMKKLDEYVDEIAGLLNFTPEEKGLLEKEKIIYIHCGDEDEVEKVTGLKTRGIADVAYDAVISSYNCHFHEISHLLMNYKLKNNLQPTLLFFLEGFATATGGRGGENKNLIFEIADYLLDKNYVTYSQLLPYKSFQEEDPSIAYSVAGLYNRFLLEHFGFEYYVNVYKRFSGKLDELFEVDPASFILPDEESFKEFLKKYRDEKPVKFKVKGDFDSFYDEDGAEILEGREYYYFRVKEPILISEKEPIKGYTSTKFSDIAPGRTYKGYKYIVTADDEFISINNLYTNDQLCAYIKSFSLSGKNVPRDEDGYLEFYIKKDVFDEALERMVITEID